MTDEHDLSREPPECVLCIGSGLTRKPLAKIQENSRIDRLITAALVKSSRDPAAIGSTRNVDRLSVLSRREALELFEPIEHDLKLSLLSAFFLPDHEKAVSVRSHVVICAEATASEGTFEK